MKGSKRVSALLLSALLLWPFDLLSGAVPENAIAHTSLVGRLAPAFTVKALDGRDVSFADYKGRVVLVNFWATWCGNCKLEMPWLAHLRDKYASQGFEVLGVLTDSASPEKIAILAQRYGVTYPILICNHATAQAYGGLPELPESFFIDGRGKIVAEMKGADSEQQIEANIRNALLGATP